MAGSSSGKPLSSALPVRFNYLLTPQPAKFCDSTKGRGVPCSWSSILCSLLVYRLFNKYQQIKEVVCPRVLTRFKHETHGSLKVICPPPNLRTTVLQTPIKNWPNSRRLL